MSRIKKKINAWAFFKNFFNGFLLFNYISEMVMHCRLDAVIFANLSKLLKLNNMTQADAKRLRVGQKLKVSE